MQIAIRSSCTLLAAGAAIGLAGCGSSGGVTAACGGVRIGDPIGPPTFLPVYAATLHGPRRHYQSGRHIVCALYGPPRAIRHAGSRREIWVYGRGAVIVNVPALPPYLRYRQFNHMPGTVTFVGSNVVKVTIYPKP